MLAQDTPAHPMTAQIEARYSGQLDREVFESALAHTLSIHPLLQSQIDRPGRPRRWIVLRDAVPFLDWSEPEEPLRFPHNREFIDLTQEIGTRVWVRAGADGGRIVLQFHHACTDGTGVIDFFFDLLRSYAAIAADEFEQLPERHLAALRTRDRFSGYSRWGRLRILSSAVIKGWHWSRMRPMPLGHTDGHASENGSATGPFDSIRQMKLPEDLLDELLAKARAAGVTLNDLLMRDLFLFLARRKADCAQSHLDCLCICMPVNLRRADEPAMPASNKIMLTFLHRRLRECADPEALLRGIHRETRQIKETLRGFKILEVLRLAFKIRGEIPRTLLNKSSFATTVLTNLGRVAAGAKDLPTDQRGRLLAGGIAIDDVTTAPNGLPGTSAVFVASTYRRQLTIAISHDRRVLSQADVDELLRSYTAELASKAL